MPPGALRLRRRSIRVRGIDYSQPGVYFVTICAHRRECLFGEANGARIDLSALGLLVQACWLEIPQHFPHVELQGYVVMPNHVHGLLAFTGRTRHGSATLITSGAPVQQAPHQLEDFGKPSPGSLATIIRLHKQAVTLRARETFSRPTLQVWHRGYFERVVRDGEEFAALTQYIRENPLRWAFDRENPARV